MTSVRSMLSVNRLLIGFVIATLFTIGLALSFVANAQEGETGGDAGSETDTTTTTETTDTSADGTVSQIMVGSSADFGEYLTDADGRAMYIFLNDTNGMSNCTGDCLVNWPPVLVTADTDLASLSADLDASLLGTIEREDGSMQLTYNGWPLYYYVGDAGAGDVAGQGVGDVWYLVTPMGTGAGLESGQPGGDAAP